MTSGSSPSAAANCSARSWADVNFGSPLASTSGLVSLLVAEAAKFSASPIVLDVSGIIKVKMRRGIELQRTLVDLSLEEAKLQLKIEAAAPGTQERRLLEFARFLRHHAGENLCLGRQVLHADEERLGIRETRRQI